MIDNVILSKVANQNLAPCQLIKNARLTKPPLPAEIMHDLQQWSEDEVSINQRQQLQPQ